MIDCGIFCRGCGGFYMFFRRLQGLFAVKMQCGNGEIVVRKWQNCGVFAACTCLISCILLPRWRNGGAMAAVGSAEMAVGCVVAGFSCLVSL